MTRSQQQTGTYDLDATMRFQHFGMRFFVVVEAKRHRNPIKREAVAVLLQKVRSIGANKGMMIATAPYQRGAVEFAVTHGISLATVTKNQPIRKALNLGASSAIVVDGWSHLPKLVVHAVTVGRRPNPSRSMGTRPAQLGANSAEKCRQPLEAVSPGRLGVPHLRSLVSEQTYDV
jgi:hypothetical protein